VLPSSGVKALKPPAVTMEGERSMELPPSAADTADTADTAAAVLVQCHTSYVPSYADALPMVAGESAELILQEGQWAKLRFVSGERAGTVGFVPSGFLDGIPVPPTQ